MSRAVALALVLTAAAGCDDREASRSPRLAEPPTRRVIDPPRRDVRALPPHAIAAGGVGPYKLGVEMERILSALPSGPRLTVLQIPSVLDVRLGRDDGLVVGGERQGPASFVAVLREGFARTADGIGVGSQRDAVVAALGPPVSQPLVARDPALWVGARLPGAQLLFAGERVAAVFLAAPVRAGEESPVRCPLVRDGSYDGAGPAGARFHPACLGAADGYAVVGDQIVVATAAGTDRPARRVAATVLAGLRWVAPVRGEGERDDLIAVSEQSRDRQRVVTVTCLRLDGSRLVPVASVEAYRLTDAGLAPTGTTAAEVELALEVATDGDLLLIGGLFVQRSGGLVRVVAPLVQVTARRSRRSPPDERPEEREPREERATPDAAGGHGGSADARP